MRRAGHRIPCLRGLYGRDKFDKALDVFLISD
jgi:hypothetical protein